MFAVSVATDARETNRSISEPPIGAVDLYWIPLGAGANVVRLSGKLFEAINAGLRRRRRCDLYHSALEVTLSEGRYVIEMTPIPDVHGERRGVVLEGAVGARLAGRLRLFRYEIRRWRNGVIPDAEEAVSSPVRVADDIAQASEILELVSALPALVWGRDEQHTGEMWNSNSVTSWLLVRGGIDVSRIRPPSGGRAPGWGAGAAIARCEERATSLPGADLDYREIMRPTAPMSSPACSSGSLDPPWLPTRQWRT
jgi:hypothetical protein